MHVVGARFGSANAARAALADLRDRFGLGQDKGAVRSLGSTDYAEPAEGHLLAARFEDHEVAEAVAAIRARGGEILELRAQNGDESVVAGRRVWPGRGPGGRAGPQPGRRAGPGRPPRRRRLSQRARPTRPGRISR